MFTGRMNAKDILMRAVQCDQAGRILEAQHLYQDGIQILMDLVAGKELQAKSFQKTLLDNFNYSIRLHFFCLLLDRRIRGVKEKSVL